jgi:hypothetical protein
LQSLPSSENLGQACITDLRPKNGVMKLKDSKAGKQSLPPTLQWGPLLLISLVGLISLVLAWPGYATHDTIWVTREAVNGVYTTYHPLLNALLIRALAVPFESYAPYTIVQIGLCCFWFWRALQLLSIRQPGWVVWASVIAWALSISTLLYLGMIWKDVPTAYALGYVASLGYAIRVGRNVNAISLVDAILLGLAVFLIIGLRHGMWFNLALIPLLLGLRASTSDKRIVLALVLAAAGLLAVVGIGRLPIVQNDAAHVLKLKIAAVAQPFLGIVTNPNGFTSDDPAYDERLAVATFGFNYRADYTKDYFRNTVVLTDEEQLERALKAILKRSPRLCLLNISSCVSGRVAMLLGTLQPSTSYGSMTFYDLGRVHASNCPTAFGMDDASCVIANEFATSERVGGLAWIHEWISDSFINKKGAIHNLVVWNLYPALLLLLACLIFLHWRNPLWLISGFFAIQMLLPFATAMANDYRYYYFLAIYFFLFAPVILATVLGRRHVRPPPRKPPDIKVTG